MDRAEKASQTQRRVEPAAERASEPWSSGAAYAPAAGAALRAMADASPRQRAQAAIAQLASGVVQRVKVGGVDITKATKWSEIVDAMKWNHLRGTYRDDLSAETLRELVKELKGRDECDDLVEAIEDNLKEAEGSSEEEDLGEKEEPKKGENKKEEGKKREEDDEEALLSTQEKEKLRKEKADAFGWEAYPDSIKGYKKLGVHETPEGNTKGLVANGPDPSRFGKGHGLGKGPGFYISHVGQKTLYNAVKAIAYENNFVAVYVAEGLEEVRAEDEKENHVDILDKKHGSKACYYVMSGGSEIIIPLRCFRFVRVVSCKDDIKAWR